MYFDLKERLFKEVCEGVNVNQLVGTAEYTAPEVIRNNVDNCFSCDMWALGCIIYKFFHGKTPFKGSSDYIIFDNVIKRKFIIDEVILSYNN
jgi:3-phosphoinositide dependent protein kinase-1